MSLALHGAAVLVLYPMQVAPKISPEELAYEMAFVTPSPDTDPSAVQAPLSEPSEAPMAAPDQQPATAAPADPRSADPKPPEPAPAPPELPPAPPPPAPEPSPVAAEPKPDTPPPRPQSLPPVPRPATHPPRQARLPAHTQRATASSAGTPSVATSAPSEQYAPSIPSVPAAPPVPAVPSPGWLAGVGAWLSAHRIYPDAARQSGQQGTVVVHFTVSQDGLVRGVTIVQGSGWDKLDQAAMALLQGARLPPFPAEMTLVQQSMTVPIHYRLE